MTTSSRATMSRQLGSLASIALLVLFYALVLHWVYRDIVARFFGYMGYTYEAPSHLASTVLILLITIVSACFLPRRIDSPSSLILWVLFIVMLAPSILLSSYTGVLSDERLWLVNLGLSGSFIAICVSVRRRTPPKPLIQHPSVTTFWLLITLFSLLVYIYLAVTAGLSLRFLSFMDVYDVRADYIDDIQNAGLVGYLVSTQANVINPLIIARGIHTKRKLIVALGVVGQLVLYSATGYKTILFSIAAIVVLLLIFRARSTSRGSILLLGASGLVLMSTALDAWLEDIFWSSFFARRFLITPGRLSNLYFEFYHDKPGHRLGESSFTPWSGEDYEQGPAHTISIWLTGSDTTAMNANFLANGYANFHWAGVFGAAVICIIYLRLLDRASIDIPISATALVVVMPAVTLSNTAIQTAMLSHGLLLAVVCLALAPREGWNPQRRAKIQRKPLEHAKKSQAHTSMK